MCGYNIQNGRCIHWVIDIKPTALPGCNIRNGEYIHLDIGITPTFLRHYNIHNNKNIHWNFNITPMALHDDNIMVLMLLIINAVGVVLLIAQGWRQPTLGYACSEEVNAVGVVHFLRGMPR